MFKQEPSILAGVTTRWLSADEQRARQMQRDYLSDIFPLS